MTSICLLLSGAALLVAGLGLLGRVPARDAAHFSLLIGATQLVLAVALAVAADGDPAALSGAAGVFLFALTYFLVGVDGVRALGSGALGWFCGLVAALGVVFSVEALAGDPVTAVLWATWAVLWALFFVLLALGRTSVTRFTGWALVITGPLTTVPPALLGLAGRSAAGPVAAGVAAVLVLLGFGAAAVLARPVAAATVSA